MNKIIKQRLIINPYFNFRMILLKHIIDTKNKLISASLGAVSGFVAAKSFFHLPTSHLQQQLNKKQLAHAANLQPNCSSNDVCPTFQIPTIYVHGFRGGDYTTNKMVLSAQKATRTHTFLKVLVNWHGELTFEGHWSTDPNPLIQIIFEDKWMPTLQIVNWLDTTLPKLMTKFHFREYNAVGHSIGATALVRLEMRNHNNANFPKLNKLVLVAGPFDGVVVFGDWPNINQLLPSGRPLFINPHYLQLLLNRRRFSDTVSVLNIYGNIDDASNTDKYISVISAKSIRYILEPTVKSFHEVEIHGKDAEHSKMHDDQQVLKIINCFLFDTINHD